MKINLGAAWTGLAGLRVGFDGWTSSRTLRFDGAQDHAKALKSAFKGPMTQASVLATPDGPQVLRSGKSGLFNLASFRRVFQPPPASRDDAAPVARSAVPQVLEPTRPRVDSGAPGKLLPQSVPLEIRLCDQAEQLHADTGHWLHADSATHGPGALAKTPRDAMLARATLQARVAAGLDELHRLRSSAQPGGHGEPAINALRERCAVAAVALALPELHRPPAHAAPDDASLRQLQNSLLALDDRITAMGVKALPLDRIVATLANQAGIREFAEQPLKSRRNAAALALSAMIDTVTRAIGPGRDGSALNALIGLSGELDTTLKALRVEATRNFMLERAGVDSQNPEARKQAEADARAVVDLEFGIATTKRMIQRELQKDGGATLLGWGGIKVDSSLVKGLRAKFGESARQVGMVVAGLVAMDRAHTADPAAQRLLQHVQEELARKRQQLEGDPKNAELREDVRYLEARERSLQTEEQLVAARLHEANKTLLAFDFQKLHSPDEKKALRHRYEMAEKVQLHWQQRLQAVSVPADLQQARDEVDRHTKTIAELETQKLTAAANARRSDAAHAPLGILSTTISADADVSTLDEQLQQARAARDDAIKLLVAKQVQRVAEHDAGASLLGGLTERELADLGLSSADAREALDTARSWARQGVSSAEQAADMLAQINETMGNLRGKRFGAGGPAARAAGVLNPITNADRARGLADALARRLTGEAGESGKPLDVSEALAPFKNSDANQRLDDLEEQGRRYARLEGELFGLSDALQAQQGGQEAARAALKVFNASEAGRVVDLDRPGGLQSSLRMRELISLVQANPDLKPGSSQRADALCKELRGYDRKTLTTAWHGRGAIFLDDVKKLAKDEDFVAALDAVIFLREQAPRIRTSIEQEIAHTVAAMDATILERGKLTGARAYGALRDATRLAILEQLEASGGDPAKFRPAEHAAAIKARLEAMGVPMNAARPEIDSFLAQSFGPAELDLWVRQASFTREEQRQIGDEMRAPAKTSSDTARGILRPETQQALLDGVDGLTVGSKVRLSAGDRVEVQTGSIAVEPTGVFGVNVKVAVGHVDGLEIARLPDSYELVLRHGWDGKAGAEVSAKLWQAKAIGMRADAYSGIEASGFRMGGVTLRFPNTSAGREAMKTVLDNLMRKGTVEARDLNAADGVMALLESKIGGKASAGAKVGFDYGTSSLPKLPGSDHASIAIGARAAVSAGVAQTSSRSESAGLVIHRSEFEVSASVSVAAGASWRFGVASAAGKTHNVSSNALEATADVAFVYKVKGREVRGVDGLVQRGAQHVVQMYLPPQAKHSALGAMGGPEFRALIDQLQGSKNSDDQTVVRELAALVDQAGPNDTISVVSSFDERMRTVVNDKLEQAQALRAGRSPARDAREAAARATRLEDEAQALLNDPKNYMVAKVVLAPTRETTQALTLLNLVAVNWTVNTDERRENVVAEIKFPEGIVRGVHDAAMGGMVA